MRGEAATPLTSYAVASDDRRSETMAVMRSTKYGLRKISIIVHTAEGTMSTFEL
jgi:hypothetical protein